VIQTSIAVLCLTQACLAEKVSTQELLRLARTRASGLEQALRDTLDRKSDVCSSDL